MSSASSPIPSAAPASKRGPAPGAGGAPAASIPIVNLDPMRLLQQYYKLLAAAVGVGLVFGVVMNFALRFTLPRYDADVAFECIPQAQTSTEISGVGVREEMETFMATKVLVMKSDQILQKVVEERSVQDTKWAAGFKSGTGFDGVEALKELRKIVRAQPIPSTTIIRLTVGTSERLDAPTIANAISDVFLDDVTQRSSRDMRNLIQQFEGQVRELRKDIEGIDRQIDALSSREKLDSVRQEGTVAYNQVQNLQPKMVDLRENLEQAKEQLKNYETMLNNPGGPVFPDGIRSEVESSSLIGQQNVAITSAKATLRAIRQEFGDKHRFTQRQEMQIRGLEEEKEKILQTKMSEVFNAAVEGLRNRVRNLEAGEAEQMGRLEKAQERLVNVTRILKLNDDFKADREQKLIRANDMESKANDLKLLVARGTRVRELSRAQPPDGLAFPRIYTVAPLCMILVVGLVAGVVVLRELREQRVRGPQDVALIPRTKVLGVIPDASMDPSSPERVERACRERPQGVIAESVRQIRTGLLTDCHSRGHKVILFVGGMPGSGATALVSNLAVNAASADVRTLIIDANLRRPAVHTIFKTPEAPGVSDILLGEAGFAAGVCPTDTPNLSVLPAGKRDPHIFERFTTASMAALIGEARRAFDMVLIDCSPAVVSSDALALAGHCDGCVLVVRAYSEKRGLVARLRNQLGGSHAEFLGVIVNGVRASAGGYFTRNFQVTHEYGREPLGDPASNGSVRAMSNGLVRAVAESLPPVARGAGRDHEPPTSDAG